jgi:hypothetical protein
MGTQAAIVRISAAAAAGRGGGGRGPTVDSPQVNAGRTITLRLLAPNAKDVVVSGELDGKEHPLPIRSTKRDLREHPHSQGLKPIETFLSGTTQVVPSDTNRLLSSD